MGAILIEKEHRACIASLFDGWEETMIWSCLQGCMGKAWADSAADPHSAQIALGDFCFFAGEATETLVRNWPDLNQKFFIMVPRNADWAALIAHVYGPRAKKAERYALKKERSVFDPTRLRALARGLQPPFELRRMDEACFNAARSATWSADLCSQFEDYRTYAEKGLGFAVFHKGELVAGASSYIVYPGGIEIEIDTRQEFRRRGLAAACGAALILACLEKNLYPSWDAHNKGSLALAEKLGYQFDRAYPVYEVAFSVPNADVKSGS